VSKLLELLLKSKGDIPDVVLPLTNGQGGRAPLVNGEFKREAAAMPEAGPPPSDESPLSRIRTLSLRVAAPSPLLPFENGLWRPSEQYRILRTKISQYPRQAHLIVITSPDSGDGKSVTAINTAAALALKAEGQVLLVDADLRKSSIHLQLGLPESPGLAEVLTGVCTPEEALVHTQEFPNLFVLSSGAPPANPVELLDSKQWRNLCAYLRGTFRYVVIDSPPMGALADYELIQAVADGVILVLRPDYTHRQLCLNALESIPESKFMGVLLNCVPDWAPGKKAGSDYYYYAREKSAARES
jgi:capsular exopolysaccharide synthesis family protein